MFTRIVKASSSICFCYFQGIFVYPVFFYCRFLVVGEAPEQLTIENHSKNHTNPQMMQQKTGRPFEGYGVGLSLIHRDQFPLWNR
jgi:hypothetical protein